MDKCAKASVPRLGSELLRLLRTLETRLADIKEKKGEKGEVYSVVVKGAATHTQQQQKQQH